MEKCQFKLDNFTSQYKFISMIFEILSFESF